MASQFWTWVPEKFKSLRNFKISFQEGMHLFQPITNTRYLDAESEENSKLKIVTFGEKITSKPNKTILLVGETGTGKSTLVDAMVNYFMDVGFVDNVRFNIVEEKGKSQSESQTSAVTVYEIYPSEDSSFPFDLTIIDTPGYGHTRGIKHDEAVARTLYILFSHDEGVKKLDAIGFVVKASENRLSDRQMYIFDAVISLFGKDMKNNIVALMTHSDGGPPTDAIQALKDAKIPCAVDEDGDPVHFLFNNRKTEVTASKSEKKVKDREIASQNAWQTTIGGMNNFLEFLKDLPPMKMVLTVDVLNKRIQIEALVTNYQDQIKYIELKQAEHMKVEKALKEQKEKCSVTVDEPYKEKVTIDDWWDTKAVTCSVCEANCHYPECIWTWSPSWCKVMQNGCCTSCPGKCHHSEHVRENWKYVISTKKVQKKYADLIKEYDVYKEDLSNVAQEEALLAAVQKQIKNATMKKNQLVEDSYQNVLKLQEIALKANSLSTYLQLDFLIEKIKETGALDRDQKVQKLEEIKSQVEKDHQSGLSYLKKKT